MKRATHLFKRICEPENLRRAFWKAQKGKSDRKEVVEFRRNLSAEITRLHEDFLAGSLEFGNYRKFEVFDPKRRTICAAPFRQRVAHHAILTICEPWFESFQIFDSYACRKGKGVYGALARARGFARGSEWFVKMDVRRYFDSVDHAVLLNLLSKRFKESRLLCLLRQVVESYETQPGKGLPIGNLTSQYFANHYLGVLDHFVKETLRLPYYLRYMDDFVFWGDGREKCATIARGIENFLKEQLHLECKPACLNSTRRGMPFLGYCVYPESLRLLRRSRKRFAMKLMACQENVRSGMWNETEAARRILPLLAFTFHAKTWKMRHAMLSF